MPFTALAGWSHYIPLTVPAAQVGSGGVTNFPVVITQAAVPSAFWTEVAFTDGRDLRVCDSTGNTALASEVAYIDTANHLLEMHFLAAALSSSVATVFYLYWGNGAATMPSATGVWTGSNGGYKLVSHCSEASGNVLDSTGTGNTLVPNAGTFNYRQAGGPLGPSLKFTTAASLTCATPSGLTNAPASWSILLKPTTLAAATVYALISRGPGGSSKGQIYTRINSNNNDIQGDVPYVLGNVFDTSAGVIDTTTYWWVHITRTSGGVYTCYVNAVDKGHATHTNAPTLNGELVIGDNQWNSPQFLLASVDEIRIADNVAWTQAWVTTEYNNQLAPATFLGPGDEVTIATGLPMYLFVEPFYRSGAIKGW